MLCRKVVAIDCEPHIHAQLYIFPLADQQPPSFPEDIDNGTIVSELHNLLTSVGGKHAEYSIPTINAVEREEGEEGEEGESFPRRV